MLCVDLTKAGTVITGNRTKTTTPIQDAEIAGPGENLSTVASQKDQVGDDPTDDS